MKLEIKILIIFLLILMGNLIENFNYYQKRYIFYKNIYEKYIFFIPEKSFKIIKYIINIIALTFTIILQINELTEKSIILTIIWSIFIGIITIFVLNFASSIITSNFYERTNFHYYPTQLPLTENYKGFTDYGKEEFKKIHSTKTNNKNSSDS